MAFLLAQPQNDALEKRSPQIPGSKRFQSTWLLRHEHVRNYLWDMAMKNGHVTSAMPKLLLAFPSNSCNLLVASIDSAAFGGSQKGNGGNPVHMATFSPRAILLYTWVGCHNLPCAPWLLGKWWDGAKIPGSTIDMGYRV